VKQEVRSVPLSGPYLDDREEQLVLEVLRSGQLSLGPAIDRFEELLAARVGAPYAAAVSSGTAGLHLLCISAGVGPGDEVITSPYSFAASANCFIYEGAVPVFADIDARTYNLDPRAVEAAVTERTKAIVAVDIYGYPCELEPLRAEPDPVVLLTGWGDQAVQAETRRHVFVSKILYKPASRKVLQEVITALTGPAHV
jgi:perosamine synthetase